MIDLKEYISAGDGIWWSQTSAEPLALVHALLDQVSGIGNVRAFVGMSLDRRLTTELPSEIALSSYGALGELRTLSRDGRLEVIRCDYSALPGMFERGELPHDVGFVQVSVPDADGYCSLGLGVDYIADAVPHTTILLAEINEQMPATHGSDRIHISRFAATVHTNRPLPEVTVKTPDNIDTAIAGFVSELIADGDTIQIGVGSLPTAVLAALHDHRDLGVHSGLISNGIFDLMQSGTITGSRKEIDTGLVVTGAALGTREFYDSIPELPVLFRPASYTHSAETLSKLGSLVSINSAIEVDLEGHVGAELRRGIYIGAIGGHLDFSRAASLTGGRSIIALRARSREESAILPAMELDSITTPGPDIDAVVTEFGIARLRGCDPATRAARLIAIAAPEFREGLDRVPAGRS